MRTAIIALAFSIPATLASQSPALEAAAAAMGGKDRLVAVRTLLFEGTATQLNFGQNLTPMAESQFEVTSFTRAVDFANNRWFHDQTRVPKFVSANMAPQRQRNGLDGDVAYNVGNTGVMGRVGGTASADRFWEFLTYPIGFIKAAGHTPGATVAERAEGAMRRITLTMPGGPISMIVDSRTNLPTRIERTVYQPMLGDVTLVTELSEYQDVSGIKVPARYVTRYGNTFTLSDYRSTSVRVDADVGNIAATDSVRGVVVQTGAPAPAPTVAVDTIAPGVWRIAGGSHHTIAIEQSNRVVLVEAPQSDARTLAAIAKAREIAPPGKPVDLVINTHHHFDHSGGFRAAVSQGLQVATHLGNKDFYERVVFPGIHRSQQDALALSPKPLRLMTVGDRHTMRDDLRTIELHHMPGNPHNGNMLVVYLPAEKILIQADLYNPPAANAPANAPPPVFPFAANLVENVTRRNLQVDRVVGIHGAPAPWSQIQAAASASRAP